MHVPRVRERVEISGHQGVFLVVWVDPEEKIADLIALNEIAYEVMDVPFAQLRRHQAVPEFEMQ